MCEKSYTSKYNLVTTSWATTASSRTCPHCSKLFKQPSHLQTHLLTHQGTRPHKCQVCQKAFTQTSHLKLAMLLHSEVKPYSVTSAAAARLPQRAQGPRGEARKGRCHVRRRLTSTPTQLKRHLAPQHQGSHLYQCLSATSPSTTAASCRITCSSTRTCGPSCAPWQAWNSARSTTSSSIRPPTR